MSTSEDFLWKVYVDVANPFFFNFAFFLLVVNYLGMEGVIYKVSTLIRVGAERGGAREPHNFFFFF